MAKRNLVVDDDMVCLKTVQKYLTEAGFEAIGALSGIQAEHLVEETDIDLMLLDIEMPVMNGFTALEQIRDLPNGKQMPVIFLTGRKDRDTVKHCASVGAEAYITKPVRKENLLERVNEVLSHVSSEREEKTVLMIDNDLDFMKKAKLSLKQYYKIIIVGSGKSALDYLNDHTANVIVLNQEMPLVEDTTVLEALLRSEKGSQIPIILLETQDTQERQDNSRMIHVQKPSEPEALLEYLKKVI